MSDDDLTLEQQEVRRLLADARHVGPVPESVVARLDRVLADLADEPVRVAPVTELATRRRRATSLLVAAAAVVAIGVGVGQVLDTGTSGESDVAASTRDESGDQLQGEAADPEAESAPEESQEDDDAAEPQTSSNLPDKDGGRTFAKLSRQAYASDVSALRELSSSADAVDRFTAAAGAAGATCLSDAWGAGQFVPVRYDGIPAVLVFRRATADTQVADLFLCGDSEPRRSVTLPAP